MPVAHVVPAIQMDDGQTDDSGAAAIPSLPCQASCQDSEGEGRQTVARNPSHSLYAGVHCMH